MKNPAVSRITHHELARWLEASAPEPRHRDEGYLLVDLRSPQDHARERIPGAQRIAIAQMAAALTQRFAAEKVIVVYDERGTRVEDAAERLAAVGFRRVQCLQGGVEAWCEAHLPLEGAWAPPPPRATTPGAARAMAARTRVARGRAPRAGEVAPRPPPPELGRRM